MARPIALMYSKILASAVAVCFCLSPLHAHGPGHFHTGDDQEEDHSGHAHEEVSSSGKSFKSHDHSHESSRWWGASLTTGWESRHVHYGVDETGNYGAYTTEVSLWVKNFIFSVWSGFGTGNDFEEWNFTAAYNLEVGSVFFIPGYTFRYIPSEEDSHGEEGEEEHHDEGHDEDHHDDDQGHEVGHSGHSHAGHSHNVYNNELFFVLGTTAIPYVTPSMAFVWNLNDTPGAFLEFRVEGDIPVYKDVVSLQPYALLGLNFGYNTNEYYGWNNFQFGIEATWKVNRFVSLFAGVNYSIAMTVLSDIDQGNVVWANTGVSLKY